jgi:hypothetical protein
MGCYPYPCLPLNPGFEEDKIVCTLKTRSLFKGSNYEALSYTWGGLDDLRMVTLNDHKYLVTAHLQNALLKLRKRHAMRRLWVDALCINQADTDERLHQVELMKLVYQNANRVLVWLGSASSDSDLAINYIEERAQDKRNGQFGSTVPTNGLHVTACRAVYSLLRRSYWNRLWIMQEVSVPSAGPLIGCGHRWLSWRVWGDGIFQIRADIRQLHGKMLQGQQIDNDELVALRELFYNFFELDEIRKKAQAENSKVTPSIASASQEPERSNFVERLRIGRYKEATDQRDHIYALLGLVNGLVTKKLSEIRIVPDYTKSFGLVHCEAFKLALHAENSREILELRNHLPQPLLPTWLPDLANGKSTLCPALVSRQWDAGGSFPPHYRPQVLDGARELKVRGVLVDTVDAVVDLTGFESASSSFIQRVYRTALATKTYDISPHCCRYLEEAIWRTLVGNRSATNSSPCPQSYGAMYSSLLRESRDAIDTSPFVQAMFNATCYAKASPHRRFLRTRDGLLGLGTPDCKEGDFVCILYGYSMPVLLRARQMCHEFVGSAYVHGIMRGEAMPAQHLNESSVEFTLR